MAATSSSPAASFGSHVDDPNLSAQSLSSITVQNITGMVATKLTRQNYITWRSLFLPVLKRFKLLGLVNGTDVCPSPFVLDSSGAQIPNPVYETWCERDQLLMIWINSTLSEDLLPLTVGMDDSKSLWQSLERRFSGASRTHIHSLHSKIQTIQKGDSSMTDYLNSFKEISDKLAAAGDPISESDLVAYILSGLSDEYDSFVDSIETRTECQLCLKSGHEALNCEKLSQFASQRSHPGPPFGMTAATSHPPSYWLTDSGASRHVTPDRASLNSAIPYTGNDQLFVVNGKASHNLLSVYKFVCDNWASLTFDPFGFYIKDLSTGKMLFQGPCECGLYPFYWDASNGISCIALSPHALMITKADAHVWHQRLGHPSSLVFHNVVNKHQLPVIGSVNTDSICTACKLGKASKLPFSILPCTTTRPFHLLHTDVWGPSPTSSCTGYKYYLIVVDDYTKYSWLYPLFYKSDVCSVFKTFVHKVQTFFDCKIQCLRSDYGGEFLSKEFQGFLNAQGITHQLSCPHTPEQNGCAERKHRHVVEMGRTLLFQSVLEPKFWVEAFQTAVYLINRLPPQSSSVSPWEKLFQAPPKYHNLKAFGCACYPWLQPYSSHKLDTKSKLCVFLGYSLHHSGYRCFDPVANKLYVSRHVTFDEHLFPFKTGMFSGSPLSSDASPTSTVPAHIPLTIPVSSSPSAVQLAHPDSVLKPSASSPSAASSSHIPCPIPAGSSPTPTPTPLNLHPMITKAKAGIHKPKVFTATKHSLPASVDSITCLPPTPTTFLQASKNSHWLVAMEAKFQALQHTGTWDLVPFQPDLNLVGCKWVFKAKHRPDGSIERNAFLHGTLKEYVYMIQPPGFVDSNHPQHVCKLKRSLYGLKQAPRAWYEAFYKAILSLGFLASSSDTGLFIKKDSTITFILVYVDDIIITGSSTSVCTSIISQLQTMFPVKDLGDLHYFLGIEVHISATGLFLHQSKYALDLLKKTDMVGVKPCSTHVASAKLDHSGTLLSDPTFYRSIVGALQYLTWTRPDLAFAVNQVCQYMHSPRTIHLQAVKRIIRYLKGTLDSGLCFTKGCQSLTAWSDADWACCHIDRRSTSGYCVFLGPNLISWSAKKQCTVARSSTEAEYRSLANTAAELSWVSKILHDISFPILKTPAIFCDNKSAIALAFNPVFHARTKHVEIDYHYIREKVLSGTGKSHQIRNCKHRVWIATQTLDDLIDEVVGDGEERRSEAGCGFGELGASCFGEDGGERGGVRNVEVEKVMDGEAVKEGFVEGDNVEVVRGLGSSGEE
ncbi:hypothetical protein ACFX11_029271 [Malus domestica]